MKPSRSRLIFPILFFAAAAVQAQSAKVENPTPRPVEVFYRSGDHLKAFGSLRPFSTSTYSGSPGMAFFFRQDGKAVGEFTMKRGNHQKWKLKLKAEKPKQRRVLAATGSRVTEGERNRILALHNQYRAEVGVGRKVTWSREIAAVAQAWADRLAKSGKFEHSPREKRNGYGENLAVVYPGKPADEACRDWYGEKKDYRPGDRAPYPNRKGAVGHYTQMVWEESSRIGAGVAFMEKGKFKGQPVIVCHYDPPGNLAGEAPFPVE